jgi:hypothetical protein
MSQTSDAASAVSLQLPLFSEVDGRDEIDHAYNDSLDSNSNSNSNRNSNSNSDHRAGAAPVHITSFEATSFGGKTKTRVKAAAAAGGGALSWVTGVFCDK